MAQNTDTIDYRRDYYKGFAGAYFFKILETIIDFGSLKSEKGIILDFGCGVGHLKKILKKSNIIGYDIEKELTEIDDYKKLSPKIIVLSGVLEHIRLESVEKLLDEFLAMNREIELLVYLPTENWISKIAMRLAGEKHAHDDHVSKYKDINMILEKKFLLKKRKYIFFKMAEVSYYAK
jgi:hypothetical protein